MLLALGDISSGNLAYGALRYSQLTATEAAERLSAALEAGDLMGLYDFGAIGNSQSFLLRSRTSSASRCPARLSSSRAIRTRARSNPRSRRTWQAWALTARSCWFSIPSRWTRRRARRRRRAPARVIAWTVASRPPETAVAVIERMFPTKISAQSLEFSWLEMMPT